MKRYIDVEDLDVFKRAYEVSLKVHKSTLSFPSIEQLALAQQIRKASKSICANLAEGFAKQIYSGAEFRRYLLISIGSSDEMRIWIKYCADLGYINQGEAQSWTQEYRDIAKMLQGLLKKSNDLSNK